MEKQTIISNHIFHAQLQDDAILVHSRGGEVFEFLLSSIIGDANFAINNIDLVQKIHKHLDLHVPVTPSEAQALGRNVYTQQGWKIMVKRPHHNKAYTHYQPINNLSTHPLIKDFIVRNHDGLLSITSIQAIPHESVSYGKEFLQAIIETYYDSTAVIENTRVVVSANPNSSVIVGHERPVHRFSEELGTPHDIVTLPMLDNFLQMTR